MRIIENFVHFQCLTLKKVLWKTKTFFENMEDRCSVENTTIESALFPYNTALSKAKVKVNIIESTKWTHHKQRSFGTTLFF